MAKDFEIKGGSDVKTTFATKAAGVVIEAGDLVTLSSGLIIKAVAGSTAIAYAPNGAASADLQCEVTIGNDFTLVGTSDANFAVTDKGIECDLIGTTTLLIDLGESTTDVFKVGIGTTAGTAGSTANVEVKINKPLF